MTQKTRLLTTAQVVERLAQLGVTVTEETVRHWARTKRLAAVRPAGGRYFFHPDDVDAMLRPTKLGAA